MYSKFDIAKEKKFFVQLNPSGVVAIHLISPENWQLFELLTSSFKCDLTSHCCCARTYWWSGELLSDCREDGWSESSSTYSIIGSPRCIFFVKDEWRSDISIQPINKIKVLQFLELVLCLFLRLQHLVPLTWATFQSRHLPELECLRYRNPDMENRMVIESIHMTMTVWFHWHFVLRFDTNFLCRSSLSGSRRPLCTSSLWWQSILKRWI